MPVVINEVPRTTRRLSDYKLACRNNDFPLLSFFFAIFAGGEHTIYCDHYAEYHKQYLTDPFQKQGLPVPNYIERVLKRLELFEQDTAEHTKMVHADANDWDEFLACLKIEMTSKLGPSPVW